MNPEQRIVVAYGSAHRGTKSYVHRDARINELHQGTSEIQRLVNARNASGLR